MVVAHDGDGGCLWWFLCISFDFFFSLFSLTLHCSSTSRHHHTNRHHHEQPPNWAFVFTLSLFPPFARSVSLSSIFSLSLSHPVCQIVTIMSNQHKPPWDQFKLNPDWFIFVSNFVIWVSDLRILSLGLLCLWFGFAMHSFGFFVWHQRERESTTRPSCWRGEQGIRETMLNWAQVGSWDTWTSRSKASPATSACTLHSPP